MECIVQLFLLLCSNHYWHAWTLDICLLARSYFEWFIFLSLVSLWCVKEGKNVIHIPVCSRFGVIFQHEHPISTVKWDIRVIRLNWVKHISSKFVSATEWDSYLNFNVIYQKFKWVSIILKNSVFKRSIEIEVDDRIFLRRIERKRARVELKFTPGAQNNWTFINFIVVPPIQKITHGADKSTAIDLQNNKFESCIVKVASV